MKKKLALLLVLAMALLYGGAFAVVQPGEDFYYLDTADVLGTEAEGAIYFCNQLLAEGCGGEIVVAALDSIDGADTYDYAYDMFNEWRIGSAEEENGFLLLMAIEEDDYYAITGPGVDGIFSSGELKRLFDEYLEPDFAKKDYEAGALKFFEAVLDKYIDRYNLDFSFADGKKQAQEYLAQFDGEASYGGVQSGEAYRGNEAYRDRYEPYEEEEDDDMWVLGLIIVIVIILIVSGSRRRRRGAPSRPVIFVGPGRHHAPHRHHAPPRVHISREPRGSASRSGFSGGGRSRTGGSASRSSTSGRSFGGSFGGARSSGGGRSFGGGAGRGRR